MLVEIVGKFYDNHSLSLVNRNLAKALSDHIDVRIVALDQYDPQFKVNKQVVKQLKALEKAHEGVVPDIQLRHSYPPIWNWPEHASTKIVYIQPWEYSKVPFEWQYKFETFADAVIVPSNYIRNIFLKGGIKPSKICTIPNGYDASLFNLNQGDSVAHLGVDKDNFNFIYVGNSQWRKGLDILINSWTRVFSKADKARLIIKDNPKVYGESNVLNELIKTQYKARCAEIIYITEDLSDKEMSDLFKASKVVVHPYRAEGFAMHVQEAVACGCIPIVSAKGPTDDYIPNGVGFKIDTRAVPINIEDPNIFAIKPGDSVTGMGSHTFVNDPIQQHLEVLMHTVYHTHDKQDMFNAVKNINTLTTWDTVAVSMVNMLQQVSAQKTLRM